MKRKLVYASLEWHGDTFVDVRHKQPSELNHQLKVTTMMYKFLEAGKKPCACKVLQSVKCNANEDREASQLQWEESI